ncbi:MAG: response regulator, partial [Pseudomonadota bacterium]
MAIQTVLIVDDSRLQRRIVSALLSNWGLEVYEAASGAEALDICKRVDPDLIVSDWMMPEMNGLTFCRKFRKLPRDSYGYFILFAFRCQKDKI